MRYTVQTKMIDAVKWNHVINGSSALRKAICEREPIYFAAYYFTEYFKFRTPDFHKEYYQDCVDLTNGTINEAVWCAFRFAAKSSVAKIALALWVICFKKKSYIGWDSQDGDNASAALFDITLALQTNKKILADFGHLYYKKQAKTAMSEAKMKRINSFITENGVKVVTFSTQQPIRGQLQGNERLDLMIFDDFENNVTKDSPVLTNKIIGHINEYRGGMPAGASALYLCNYLTDSGSVAHIMETLRGNPKARIRFTPVKDAKGKIAWPDKFVNTEAEALELNRNISDPKLHKMALDAMRVSLSKDGLLYETEMMLNPSKSGDLFFERSIVDKAIIAAREPDDNNAGFKTWAKFNPKHRYGMGADTAEGLGNDSNASVIINFSTAPNLLVGAFEDNQMSNTTFGWELKRQGAVFGYPYIVPEINNTGYGTVAELLTAEYPSIYLREVKNRVSGKIQKEYGWRATTGTKYQVLGEFKQAFESGELEILDIGLLTEMKYFTKAAARLATREKGATRHFDKLRAAALAWEARKFAPMPIAEKKKMFSVPGQDKPYRP